MGLTDVLGIASSSLAAQRVALEVTGENIANVNAEGYSKQRVTMESRLSITPAGVEIGTGVQVVNIARSYDSMLQQQMVSGNSAYQQNLTRQLALQQVEPSFNELQSDGLGASIDSFFGAWQDLSTNAGGMAERQALLSKSQVLADNFHNMNTALVNVASTADNTLIGAAADVSENARSLAQVNIQIVSTQSLGGNANALMDQRDLLLQKMSEKAGISFTIQNDGTASVSLPGGGNLVSGPNYATLYTQQNAGTPPTNDLYLTAMGNPPPGTDPSVDTNVTAAASSSGIPYGEIGGLLQVRDSVVPSYISRLDEMAQNLVNSVNSQHQLGYALNGSTGNNFFAPAGVTAGTISLDPALSTTTIAAATNDPTGGSGAADNGNAAQILAIKNANQPFTSGADTLDGYYSSLVSQVGIDVQSAQHTATQGSAFLKQLNSLRASTAGVSLDEELVNLMKYQQAFQGAAKLMNAASDMLDIVLSMVR